MAGLLVCHLVRAAADAAGYRGPPASLPVYGVVGAGATLSGTLRYKATAVLITVEATGAWSLVVPVVISGARLPCCPALTRRVSHCTCMIETLQSKGRGCAE